MTFIKIASKYSKASEARLQAMEDALRYLDANSISGDVVECGVWKGGHIILARLASPQRKCWLYDTFEGMTRPTEVDMKRDGFSALKKYEEHVVKNKNKWAASSLDEVVQNLRDTGTFDQYLTKFVIGDVRHTLTDANNIPEEISLLRLDTDWYESTHIEMRQLYPRLVSGGILIVDDYNHWMGAKKAVDEYLCAADRERLKPIDYTAVMIVKL